MTSRTFPSIVDYAYEIIRMDQEIQDLRAEVERLAYYKEQYLKLLDESSRHTNKMFGIAIAGSLGDIELAKQIANS